ncbi:MAG: hypothetical protein JWQ02_1584, partial [Capsulimonas sp.]|nr:hypothetical protein [Capsulimonas sp.]
QSRRLYLSGGRSVSQLPASSDRMVVVDFLEFWTEKESDAVVRKNFSEQIQNAVSRFGYGLDMEYLLTQYSAKTKDDPSGLYDQLSRRFPALSKDPLFQLRYGLVVQTANPTLALACYDRVLQAQSTEMEKAQAHIFKCMALVHLGKLEDANKDAEAARNIAQKNGFHDLEAQANEQLAAVQRWRTVMAKEKVEDGHIDRSTKPKSPVSFIFLGMGVIVVVLSGVRAYRRRREEV